MADEETRRQALILLEELIIQADDEEWEMAVAFVVLTTNGDTHDIHLNGPFTERDDAQIWAEQHEHDLNYGSPPNEIPFVVKVYPVVPMS